MVQVITPPTPFNRIPTHSRLVFFAGSIEMGRAEPWQDDLIARVKDMDSDVIILNPRRPDWDSSWTQTIENEQFREQVEWELNGLSYADRIFLYLAPGTISPISLLELGIHIHNRKVVVCCPDGFQRKGNVEIVCNRYNVRLHHEYDRFADEFIAYCHLSKIKTN